MTEDEIKNDVNYLRGRIDAVELILDSIVGALPVPLLRSMERELARACKDIAQKRDADPVHIDWDMADRSHNRPDKKPPITLHTDGFLSYAQPWSDATAEIIYEIESGDRFARLSPTAESVKNDAEWQRALREMDED